MSCCRLLLSREPPLVSKPRRKLARFLTSSGDAGSPPRPPAPATPPVDDGDVTPLALLLFLRASPSANSCNSRLARLLCICSRLCWSVDEEATELSSPPPVPVTIPTPCCLSMSRMLVAKLRRLAPALADVDAPLPRVLPLLPPAPPRAAASRAARPLRFILLL